MTENSNTKTAVLTATAQNVAMRLYMMVFMSMD